MSDWSDDTEHDSFESMWASAQPRMRAVLARYRIPYADAKDLIQDVFMQYWKKRQLIATPERWLPCALELTCRMYWRTRGRSITIAVDDAILGLMSKNDGPKQERTVIRRELKHLIGTLKKKCREVLTLRYLGFDRHEVAAKTKYAISGIDKIAKRCEAELAEKFRVAAAGLSGAAGRRQLDHGEKEDPHEQA